jgi:hypothetical protein
VDSDVSTLRVGRVGRICRSDAVSYSPGRSATQFAYSEAPAVTSPVS